MKLLSTLLTCLFLLSPNLAMSETLDDLVKRDGVYYKKFTSVPFTGKVTGQVQGTIINGRRHGSWVTYYTNGRPNEKITYVNGELHGPYVWYNEDGTIEGEGRWVNGKRIPD